MDDVLLKLGWVRVECWGEVEYWQPLTGEQYDVLQTPKVNDRQNAMEV